MAANFWLSSQCQKLLERARTNAAAEAAEAAAAEEEKDEREREKEEKKRRKIGNGSRKGITIKQVEKREEEGGGKGKGKGNEGKQLVRLESIQYLFQVGRRLKIRQRPLLTACVYIHTLPLREDNIQQKVIALSCLYLSCKVEETPVSIDRLLKFSGTQEGVGSDDIIDGELVVLEALSTSLVVHHPHQDMRRYVESFPAGKLGGIHGGEKHLLELAELILTDTYHTDLCLRLPPHIIALGCIYMANALEGRNVLPAVCHEIHVDENEVLAVASEMVNYYRVVS